MTAERACWRRREGELVLHATAANAYSQQVSSAFGSPALRATTTGIGQAFGPGVSTLNFYAAHGARIRHLPTQGTSECHPPEP